MSSPTESEVAIEQWTAEFNEIEKATSLARILFALFHNNANIYDHCLLSLFCTVQELREEDVIRPLPPLPSFKQWYVDTLVTKEQPIGPAIEKLRVIMRTVESINVTGHQGEQGLSGQPKAEPTDAPATVNPTPIKEDIQSVANPGRKNPGRENPGRENPGREKLNVGKYFD